MNCSYRKSCIYNFLSDWSVSGESKLRTGWLNLSWRESQSFEDTEQTRQMAIFLDFSSSKQPNGMIYTMSHGAVMYNLQISWRQGFPMQSR